MSKFVISLDLELYWGVAASRSWESYRQNLEGERIAIPNMLQLFQQYDIKATWATVGMLMCRDYQQWRAIRPSLMPGYVQPHLSTYRLDTVVREYPELFFARSLVEQLLNTPGQEVASHTYSHFFCGAEGATTAQFKSDLDCARFIAQEMGVNFRSIVFPRNQVVAPFLEVLMQEGIKIYRGNPDHPFYREGHFIPGGRLGRAARFADGWLPLSGNLIARVTKDLTTGLINVPASLFLRPYSKKLAPLEPVRLTRMKNAMTAAAKTDGVFHLWWHPHNFGINTEQNLKVLERLLQHYLILRDRYGMQSVCMGDFSGKEVT